MMQACLGGCLYMARHVSASLPTCLDTCFDLSLL